MSNSGRTRRLLLYLSALTILSSSAFAQSVSVELTCSDTNPVGAPFLVRAEFSEPVTGLQAGEITATNGTISLLRAYPNKTISAGADDHFLVVRPDGSLGAWGWNGDGQTNVPAGTDYAAVSAGYCFSLAMHRNGTFAGWGRNDLGQTNVPGFWNYLGYLGMDAGGMHSIAIEPYASLVCWGDNTYGQSTPPFAYETVRVAAGEYHTLVLRGDGSMAASGYNYFGPCTVPDNDHFNPFIDIDAGADFSIALRADGSIAAWGLNSNGQCTVPGGGGFTAISAGYEHSVALRSDGSLAAWGRNNYGQCTVPTGNDYIAISAGKNTDLALKSDGTLVTWGTPVTIPMGMTALTSTASRIWLFNVVPTVTGQVTLQIPAGMAVGTSSNTNATSNLLTWNYKSTGDLYVTISPAEAVSAGAQWRRVGTSTWFNSGDTEANIPRGTYQIEFKAATGYDPPANKNITITPPYASTASATYIRQTGTVRVTLAPAEAVSAGAGWSIDGGTTWRSSGQTITTPTGNYTVQFKAVSNFNSPASQSITVSKNQLTTATATYTMAGSLRVGIAPAQAAAYGGRWRRTNTSTWLAGGATEAGLAVGQYSVEFLPIDHWTAPQNQTLSVAYNQITDTTGTYTRQPITTILSSVAGNPVGGVFTINALFSEPVTGLTSGDIQVTNGAVSGFTSTSAQAYVFDVTPTSIGMVAISIPAGAAQATDTMPNLASNVLERNYVGSGNLRVNLAPATVKSLGAKWRRSGTSTWLASGATESNMMVGSYQLEFTPVYGWESPTSTTATIAHGQTFETTCTYTLPPIAVTLSSTKPDPVCGPFPLHASFRAPIDGLDRSDVHVTNATMDQFWPIELPTLAAGNGYSFVLSTSGTLVGWGLNGAVDQALIINPPAGKSFKAVSTGGNMFTVGLLTDGGLCGWGKNDLGQINVPTGNDFVAIAAGENHALALRRNGSITGWGENAWGQASPPAGNYIAVSAGTSFSVALRSDGSLAAWGSNSFGLTAPPSGNDFVAISAGLYHCLALRADGSLVAWGYNYYGQATVPVGTDFVAISAGGEQSMALRSDGSLIAWGKNGNGQTNVPAGNDYVAISMGPYHGLAVHADGMLAAWGLNTSGQCNIPAGLLSRPPFIEECFMRLVPDQPGLITASIDAGVAQGIFGNLTAASNVFTRTYVIPGSLRVNLYPPTAGVWAGWRRVGTAEWLANGAIDTETPPGECRVEFQPIPGWVTPTTQTLAITATQLTETTGTYTPPPITAHLDSSAADPIDELFRVDAAFSEPVAGFTHADIQAAGCTISKFFPHVLQTFTANNQFVLIVGQDGGLAAWGSDYLGQLNCPEGTDFKAVSTGENFGVTLCADGSLAAWGKNDMGQTNVPAGNNFIAIASGNVHSLALRADGSLAGWGDNVYGQATAPSGNNFAAIDCGNSHSLALRTDGSLVAWGNNGSGQCNVPSGNDFVAIAAGDAHNLALRADGSMMGWGYNNNGQATARAGNDFVAIACGADYSLALRANGTLVQWGTYYGTLPVPTGNDFAAIAAGRYNGFAMRTDGRLEIWGANDYSQCILPSGVTVRPQGVQNCWMYIQPVALGPISISIPAGAARGANLNYNLASNVLSRTNAALGGLNISIGPSGVAAQARWRRSGTSSWLAAGATGNTVPIGVHTIEFNAVDGWIRPVSQTVTVSRGQTTAVTGTYVSVTMRNPVWFNHSWAGIELGTIDQPFNSMLESIDALTSGGTIKALPGNTPERLRITKPMRIEAVGGTATIGR